MGITTWEEYRKLLGSDGERLHEVGVSGKKNMKKAKIELDFDNWKLLGRIS